MSRSDSAQRTAYKKILIVRTDRIGDVVLSTPVIKAVRDAYTGSHIAMLVRPYARDIVEGNPYLNEVIVYDKSGSEKDLRGNIRFIDMLKNKRFDLAIMLHPTQRTHMVAAFAGIPVRVGYDRKCGFLLTKRIPHTKQFGLKHEIDYALDMLRYIGIAPKDRSLYMPVNKESESRIEKLLGDNGIRTADTVIAVNPGASCPSKRWACENFAAAARGLIKKYGAKIIIIAGRDDQAYGDKTASLIGKGCLNLSGKTSVADLASVLKRAKLFISNDSGPVHIACAVGTPVIAIFGRSDRGLSPDRWGPSGKNDIVIHKDVGCDVCLAHSCRIGFKCLEAITAEEVLKAADQILERR
jgi:heptosyltransferase II